jgi:thiamine biosynthesis lipoprotein
MTGQRLTFEAIGTRWTVDIFSAMSAATAKAVQQEVLERIDVFDRNYSRFRADSLVTEMSRKPGSYTLPGDAKPLMDLYFKLYQVSGGTVTPLIGRTLEQAGYDAHYSLKPGRLTTPPQWEEVMDYDFPYLTLHRPALLDFGAAGKGYLVDIVSRLLHGWGVSSYCINAGGDILYQTSSDELLDIGLEHPGDPELAIGVAHLHNQSLCGSAGNRRAWGEFHHIMSPRTLRSPGHLAAAWVAAENALLADGLATAVFFVNPKILQQHFNFEYALVRADFSLTHSPGFPADFFVGPKSEKIS